MSTIIKQVRSNQILKKTKHLRIQWILDWSAVAKGRTKVQRVFMKKVNQTANQIFNKFQHGSSKIHS